MTKGKKLVLQHFVPQKLRHGLSSSHNMRSLSICPIEIQEESTTIHPSAEGWGPISHDPFSIWKDLPTYFSFHRCLSYQFSDHDLSKSLTIQPIHWLQPLSQ